MKRFSKLLTCVALTIAGFALTRSARADVYGFLVPTPTGTIMYVDGVYSLPGGSLGNPNTPSCNSPALAANYFYGGGTLPCPCAWRGSVLKYCTTTPGSGPDGFDFLPARVPVLGPGNPGFFRITGHSGTPPNEVSYVASYPFANVYGCDGTVVRPASAGPVSLAAGSLRDSLRDSVGVTLTRGTGLVTIAISGFTRHFNPRFPMASRLRVTVWAKPSDAVRSHGGGGGGPEVAHGEMRFKDKGVKEVEGLFGSADFSAPTEISPDVFQVATVGGLQKQVTVPLSDSACVEVLADPDGSVVPASSPPTLLLLASLLLGGATWFTIRRRSRLA